MSKRKLTVSVGIEIRRARPMRAERMRVRCSQVEQCCSSALQPCRLAMLKMCIPRLSPTVTVRGFIVTLGLQTLAVPCYLKSLRATSNGH